MRILAFCTRYKIDDYIVFYKLFLVPQTFLSVISRVTDRKPCVAQRQQKTGMKCQCLRYFKEIFTIVNESINIESDETNANLYI